MLPNPASCAWCTVRPNTLKYQSLKSVHSLSRVQLFANSWTEHTRLPCPSPTPGACSNSSPSSRWCHPTISSSVVRFSSCLQSSPASGSFPRSLLSLELFSLTIRLPFSLSYLFTSCLQMQSHSQNLGIRISIYEFGRGGGWRQFSPEQSKCWSFIVYNWKHPEGWLSKL